MLGFLLYLLLVGIIAGYLARALVPGPDPMSFWQTVGLGIVGSFVGGFLGSLLLGSGEALFSAAGIIGSIVGAVVALLIYRAVGGSRNRTRGGSRETERV